MSSSGLLFNKVDSMPLAFLLRARTKMFRGYRHQTIALIYVSLAISVSGSITFTSLRIRFNYSVFYFPVGSQDTQFSNIHVVILE